ncbi:MAG: hypothetical protein OXF75_12935 [Acidimicrobiaceae bacterium]|nr:hypothetical protein [Acidimicrobiaceae bacterium]
MDGTNFVDAIPIIAAILGPMLGFMLYSHRIHHKDVQETRNLIHSTNLEIRDLIHSTNLEIRDLIHSTNAETTKKLTELIIRSNRETRDAAKRDHKELKKDHNELKGLVIKIRDSLADVRERLAGIEGHLGLGSWAKPEADSGPEAAGA